ALRAPPIPQKEVFDLFWIPDTTVLAVGALKSPVLLVDMATGRVASEIGETAEIRAGFVLSPDGRTLLCGGMGKCIDAHDLFSGQTRPFCSIPPDHVNFGGGYSPDGKLVALTFFTEKPDEKTSFIRIVNAASGETVRDLAVGPGMLIFSRFLKSGRQIVVAGFKRKPAVFDAGSGALVREIGEELDQTLAFDLDVQRGIFVAPGANHALKVYDIDTGMELGELAGHTDTVTRAFFSPDRKRLVTLSTDKTARVWDLATRTEIAQRAVGRTNDVIGITFSGDGREVICVGEDGQIVAWDYEGKSTLSKALKLDARVLVALAQSRTDSRLKGFELETHEPPAANFVWATQDGAPLVAPVGEVSQPSQEVLPEAAQKWLADARTWLSTWIVDHAVQSWRRLRAACRYTEKEGSRYSVDAATPWLPGHFVDYSLWWLADKYGKQAEDVLALEKMEAERNWAGAYEVGVRLRLRNREDPWMHFRAGRAALRQRQWFVAQTIFETALNLDGSNQLFKAYHAAARAHSDDARTRLEALEALDVVIANGTTDALILVARALCYLRLALSPKDDAKAVEDLESALKFESDNA
ncbi:hypothetical protein PLCT1_00691, partial [Planctomycetaceae bacterium]